ncbi:MAG TPA: hypothetical protein VLS25_11120 [Dehalococcoidia bacterium]|nr:hypothetical protein [Dehalococcoidia bacterium]
MSQAELQALRRIVTAVERLRGAVVSGVTVRSDLRHLKVDLVGGLILLIAADRDDQGRPRLEVDVIEAPQDPSAQPQIEVHFD